MCIRGGPTPRRPVSSENSHPRKWASRMPIFTQIYAPRCPYLREYEHPDAQIHGEYRHPVVKIGIPHGCLYSRKYGHRGPCIYVKLGIPTISLCTRPLSIIILSFFFSCSSLTQYSDAYKSEKIKLSQYGLNVTIKYISLWRGKCLGFWCSTTFRVWLESSWL